MSGYKRVGINGRSVEVHILVAEAAFGGPLPPGSIVHHVDENRLNNSPDNLVVCPGHAYHKLLHRRTDALNACGNANWVRCSFCQAYGPRETMLQPKRSSGDEWAFHHRSCQYKYDWYRAQAKREQKAAQLQKAGE